MAQLEVRSKAALRGAAVLSAVTALRELAPSDETTELAQKAMAAAVELTAAVMQALEELPF